jgi:hypothetical protein
VPERLRKVRSQNETYDQQLRSYVKRISEGEDPGVGDDSEPVGETAEVGRGDVGTVGEGQLLVRRAHDLHGRAAAAVPLVVPSRHGRCDSEVSLARPCATLLSKRMKRTSGPSLFALFGPKEWFMGLADMFHWTYGSNGSSPNMLQDRPVDPIPFSFPRLMIFNVSALWKFLLHSIGCTGAGHEQYIAPIAQVSSDHFRSYVCRHF